jgi:hypothetical protein
MESETRALNSWQGLPETRISSVEFMTSPTGIFSSVGIYEIFMLQFMDAHTRLARRQAKTDHYRKSSLL